MESLNRPFTEETLHRKEEETAKDVRRISKINFDRLKEAIRKKETLVNNVRSSSLIGAFIERQKQKK